MSEENVEIVRDLYETVSRGDAAAVLALYDAEVEWDMTRGPLAGLTGWGVYRGHEGLRRFFRERYEAWEEIEDDCEELIDAGDQVISVTTTRGRGRGSGIEIEGTNASIWTIRDGKIARVVWFGRRDEALEAAGLSG
jgi:ketosteroid isomerase-like protein